MDRWVISHTIDWLIQNPSELKSLSVCSINLSGQSVGNPEIKDFIVKKLSAVNFPAEKLCFEITETAAISDISYANELITTLKKYGCKFALDDFGSGLSSFSYLKDMAVDYIKIDGIFVKDMLNVSSDKAIVKAISDVAKTTGKQTIAEYVETQAVADELKRLGVEFAQGYCFDKPSPLVVEPHIVHDSTKEVKG